MRNFVCQPLCIWALQYIAKIREVIKQTRREKGMVVKDVRIVKVRHWKLQLSIVSAVQCAETWRSKKYFLSFLFSIIFFLFQLLLLLKSSMHWEDLVGTCLTDTYRCPLRQLGKPKRQWQTLTVWADQRTVYRLTFDLFEPTFQLLFGRFRPGGQRKKHII